MWVSHPHADHSASWRTFLHLHSNQQRLTAQTESEPEPKIANRANALFITAARDNIPRRIAKVRLLRRQLEDTVAKDDQEGE